MLVAPKHFQKQIFEYRLTDKAQPLRFVLILMRTEAEKPGHLRESPGERMWERYRRDFADVATFAEPHEACAPVSMLIERHNQRAIKGRGEKRTGGMAQVMVKTFDAPRRISREAPQDAEIIQLAPQLAGGLVQEVSARRRSEWREARAKKELPRPSAHGTACDHDVVQITPLNPSTIEAEADGRARNPLHRT